jgi:hypothetical protein
MRFKHAPVTKKRPPFDVSLEESTSYPPLITQVHRWSDRRKVVQLPLFPCYAFVHMALSVEPGIRARTRRTYGNSLAHVGLCE